MGALRNDANYRQYIDPPIGGYSGNSQVSYDKDISDCLKIMEFIHDNLQNILLHHNSEIFIEPEMRVFFAMDMGAYRPLHRVWRKKVCIVRR